MRAFKVNLVIFKVISRLKVNFNKSMSVGVNVPDCWLVEAFVVLNCKIEHIPFVYLGLPIGSNPLRLSFSSRSLIAL